MVEFTFSHLLILFGAYFLGGLSRGVVGFGLPVVAVPIMSLIVPVHFAMASVVFPSVATGLVVLFRYGHPWSLIRRFQGLFMTLIPVTYLTVGFLSLADPGILFIVMGVMVLIFTTHGLFGGGLHMPAHLEKPLAPVVGAVTGALTGLTGISGPVVVMYFYSLDLERRRFAQAVAAVVVASTLVLGMAITSLDLGGWREMLVSAIAVIPAVAGTVAGGALIDRIPPVLFRNILLTVLMAVGLSLLGR